MSNYSVVIVDDELPNLESLERIFISDGARVVSFQDPQQALAYLRESRTDVVLTDLRMNRMSGVDLLEATKLLDRGFEVILMTAYGTVEIAVDAMKKGAYDFVTKPLQKHSLLKAVHRALEHRRLVGENCALREELQSIQHSPVSEVIGKSEAMRKIIDIAFTAAKSQASVLIEGESGTGKGVLAESIHAWSGSTHGIFVKINCTTIPEALLEAELFGAEPGAYTGASKRRKGRVELADKGTLFLDEIGIAPPTFQTKLLRFLQEGEFERLGSNETIRVQARVISATNVNLKKAIEQGQFREDLYYRLNVVNLKIPPLRERHEDIPLLVHKFLDLSAKKNLRGVPVLDKDALESLCRYHWPGNIRELQNVIERAVVLDKNGVIAKSDLPPEIGHETRETLIQVPLGMPLRLVEKKLLEETLRLARGDKRLAARMLGIHPRTIYRHLEATVPTPEPLEKRTETSFEV